MHINHLYFPREVITQILQNGSLISPRVCKLFNELFHSSFLTGLENNKPLIRERLHSLPSTLSDQEKIKCIYQGIFYWHKEHPGLLGSSSGIQDLSSLPPQEIDGDLLEELDNDLENASLTKMFKSNLEACLHTRSLHGKEFIVLEGDKMDRPFYQVVREWMHQYPKALEQYTNFSNAQFVLTDEAPKLPKEIGLFKNLTSLYLNTGNITQLPPEIGQLTNLKEIYIEFNDNLFGLPNEIKNLKKLKIISISSNQRNILEPFLEHFKSLGTEIKENPRG